jgi:hypothetical protein
MTDFLTSLVRRSFEHANGIRPRLASLFEPLPGSGPVVADLVEPRRGDLASEVTAEPDHESPSIEERAPQVTRTRTAERHEGARMAIDVKAPVSAPHSPDGPDPTRAQGPVGETPIHESAGLVPRREEQRDSTPPEPSRGSFGQTPTTTASFSSTKNAAGGDAAVGSRAVIAPPKTIDDQERSLLVAPAISARIAAEMQAAVSAWGRGRDERLKGDRQRSVWATDARSEPTIHVSIGRVEVRATTDGSRPLKQRSASPVMSLDEYLRARRGGQ